MSDPLVSIIIPCYNSEKWAVECIQSCLNQTYKNIEIILVDDGSTDKSVEIVRNFNSAKIKIIQQQSKGACAARNTGFEISRGDYIQYLDADDFLSQNKINEQMEAVRNLPAAIAVCPTISFLDGEAPALKTETPSFMLDTNEPGEFLIRMWGGEIQIAPGAVWTSAWLSPREVLQEAGGWDSRCGPDDDGEYFCRVLLKSAGIRVANSAFNYHRRHRGFVSLGSLATSSAWEQRVSAVNSKSRYFLEKNSSLPAKRAIAQLYLKIMSATYPQFPEISKDASRRADALGIKNRKPYFDGRVARLICHLFGWKAASWYCFLKQKILSGFKN